MPKADFNQYYWIFVEKLWEPGRENYTYKPRAVTESYFDLLGTGELQHTIQVADWDIITPESLWIGNKELAEKVIQSLHERMDIKCQIRTIPEFMINSKTGTLNYKELRAMEKLIQSTETKLTVASEGEGKEGKEQKPKSGRGGEITVLGKIILNKELTRRLIFKEHGEIDYINIYYYREQDNPPVYDNILNYPACLVRFNPKMPEGWRYMCSLNTYAKLIREKFIHVIEKGWNIPFERGTVNQVLEDFRLFSDLMIEVTGAIVWEGECFGNLAEI